jgi:GNAT superfamily N-acetyltransferase
MQQRSYAMYYPQSEIYTISVNEACAGKLHVADCAESLVLVDIALLPQYWRQGIGTKLLSGLQRRADEAGKPLRLTATAGSYASQLYEKLGFRTIETNEVHVRMEWNAADR